MQFLRRERDSTENLCAAGTFRFRFHSGSSTNNQHVQKLTESLSEMALAIGNLDVNAKLCVSDVRSNEIFYHKITFQNFITDMSIAS